MKRVLPVLALTMAGAGCTPTQGALSVAVNVPASALSTHLVVTAGALSTPCLAIASPTVLVAVTRGTQAATIALSATGYTDAACTAEPTPAEHAGPTEATFKDDAIRRVELTLNPVTPRVETACADGVDNDRDGLIDCQDPDCEAQACSSGNACVTGERCAGGQCSGGQAVQCTAGPACHHAVGVCSGAGCRYALDPGASCDDHDPCTEHDTCAADGTCLGAPVTCQTPPTCHLLGGACQADAGCLYQPASAGSGCTDDDPCTTGDQCDGDGGCAGHRVTCTAPTCQRFAGVCTAGGVCQYSPSDAGTPCDGGTCNGSGACVP